MSHPELHNPVDHHQTDLQHHQAVLQEQQVVLQEHQVVLQEHQVVLQEQEVAAHKAGRTSTWTAIGFVALFFAAPKALGTLIGIALVLVICGFPTYVLWRVTVGAWLAERRRREAAAVIERQRREAAAIDERRARAERIDALERELGIGWYGIGEENPAR